jgi:penicillin-binding protein 2
MIGRRWFKKRRFNVEIEPDEIFMDAQNIPEFDTQQFEGRLEKPIGKGNILFLGVVFILVGIIFSSRLVLLQLKKGYEYFQVSEKNSLKSEPLFADRGVIYDRNGVELAWNTVHDKGEPYLLRRYIASPGFAHLLGYVSYPEKDSDGNYWQTEYIGKDGVEDEYNDIIAGKNGARLFETNALGERNVGSALNPPEHGTNLNLTIDSRIQSKLYEAIVGLAERAGYRGGAGLIMDIDTGELIAMTSYPEYDTNILATGEDKVKIQEYLLDTTKKPFINRAVSGVYTPGSIVKPFVAIGALQEGVVDPNQSFYSSGELVVPNPYYPELKSVFKDWKEEGHGYTDMRKGLAESVNTYFYIISGGFKDQKGIGIANIEKYTRMFGIASKTNIDIEGEKIGNIPSIEWKAKKFLVIRGDLEIRIILGLVSMDFR